MAEAAGGNGVVLLCDRSAIATIVPVCPAEAVNRLVAFVPMRAEDAAVDAAGVGAGRSVLAAAPRALVDATLQPYLERGTLPARLEPAGVACVRLLKRLVADEGPRTSALALLGADADRYVALDAVVRSTWLGGRVSNPDFLVQSQASCR